jgi:hypothetical protein
LVQPLLSLQHFPEEWCHSRAAGDGGVKNNINKLNRNAGGQQQEGLRWGVWGRGGEAWGSQRLLAFSHQRGEFCKGKKTKAGESEAGNAKDQSRLHQGICICVGLCVGSGVCCRRPGAGMKECGNE